MGAFLLLPSPATSFRIILVNLGWNNKIPETGWLKHFSQFWRLESPRSRCWQIRCLVRACFLACRQLPSYSILTWSRKRPLVVSSPYKGTNPIAMDWMFVCPQIHMLKHSPQCDGTWRWVPWEVISSWGSTLMNGVITLIKEVPKNSLTPSAKWSYREKSTIYEPGSKRSSDTESASILILNFLASSTMRNKFLFFISHQSMVFW